MPYEVKDPLWQCVDHWQTLITGVLALLAALGTIVVTRSAAKKQIKATRDQIEVMERLERRRIARESHSFLTMLRAAMNGVIEDVQAASHILGGHDNPSFDAHNQARRSVKKTAFADLRSACIRLGGFLTEPFLRLEKEIDDLNERVIKVPAGVMRDLNSDLLDQLKRIKLKAECLQTEAANEMERCNKVLAEPPPPSVT